MCETNLPTGRGSIPPSIGSRVSCLVFLCLLTARCLQIYNKYLLPTFERIIVEEQIDFRNPEVQNVFLKDVPEDVATALRDEWSNETTNSYKWKKFKVTMVSACFPQGVENAFWFVVPV